MKIEEAIKWMEEAIQDTKEFFDQCSPALQEELTKQKEVFEFAIAALRSMQEAGEYHFREVTKMVPLTLEQLREMDGKPVWVDYIGDITCPSQWCVVNTFLDKVGNTDFEFPFECDPDEGYGKTWLAYAYPPVHIDTGEWGGCDCDKPKSCCTCCSMQCHRCIGQSEYKQAAYCLKCGKPQTEKAWAELGRRMAGGADTNVGGRSWISVENRLPKEKDGRVLVFHPDDFRTKINVAQYSEYSDMWYIGDMCAVSPTKPTHWMPLPEPPEVKDHG